MTLVNILKELLEKPFKYSIHKDVNTMLTYSEIQHLERLYPVLMEVGEEEE